MYQCCSRRNINGGKMIRHKTFKANSRVQRFIFILFNIWDHMTVTMTAGRILSGLCCLAMSVWVYIHTGLIGGSKSPSLGVNGVCPVIVSCLVFPPLTQSLLGWTPAPTVNCNFSIKAH